jgi:hypothetical protein
MAAVRRRWMKPVVDNGSFFALGGGLKAGKYSPRVCDRPEAGAPEQSEYRGPSVEASIN